MNAVLGGSRKGDSNVWPNIPTLAATYTDDCNALKADALKRADIGVAMGITGQIFRVNMIAAVTPGLACRLRYCIVSWRGFWPVWINAGQKPEVS